MSQASVIFSCGIYFSNFDYIYVQQINFHGPGRIGLNVGVSCQELGSFLLNRLYELRQGFND